MYSITDLPPELESQSPLVSSSLDIYLVSGEISDEYHSFPISYLQCKAVRIPNLSSKRKDSYAIFPLNVESND